MSDASVCPFLNSTSMNANQAAVPNSASAEREFQKMFVHDLVGVYALGTPNALAAACGDRRITYQELERHASQLAYRLQSLGVGPDVVVGLYLNRSVAMIVGALAILKAGGAYLPLDPASPAERLRFLLDDAKAAVLVTSQCLAPALSARTEAIVVVDPEGRIPDGTACNIVSTNLAPNNLAYVIYTSGSTGHPKGVELTHRGLLNLVLWHQSAFKITSKDRASHLASLGFDAAVWEIWPYLAAGASVHLGDGLAVNEPMAVRDWLISREISVSFLATPLAERLMTLEWPTRHCLRLMLTGADTLHHYPSRKLRFQLVNNYGPTECTVVATSGLVPPIPERTDQLPSIGRPIDNVQIYILDEKMRPVPSGATGEIYIGGPGVGRGYRNRPDLTAEKFVANPFGSEPGDRLYRTGDLARFLDNGEIAFQGRIDEQVKIRGYRIEPAEIVRALDEHPAVQASSVVVRETDPGEKRLVAYFVPELNAKPTHTELRNFVANRVPEYMVPALFVKLNALPLNSSGKVDRTALPVPDRSNTLRDNDFITPRTPIEERIATMLASLLDLGEVSVEDNFFLLGGHSLLGTQLIARIRDAFEVELSLKALFDAPTVARLASEVETLLLTKLEAMTDDEARRLLSGPVIAAA